MTDTAHGNPMRDLLRVIDLSDQPGRFRATWCTPDGGGYMAFSGTYTLNLAGDGSHDWIASYTEGGHAWSGRSQWAHGAFLAMLADRCGLAATVTVKPEETAT